MKSRFCTFMTQASKWQCCCTGAVTSSGDGKKKFFRLCSKQQFAHLWSFLKCGGAWYIIYLFESGVTPRLHVVNCIYWPSNLCNCAQNIHSPRRAQLVRFSVHPIAICESPSKRCPLAEDAVGRLSTINRSPELYRLHAWNKIHQTAV